ncbi:hypothetical protein CR513_56497, partial [Mucuna pruriens]
MEPWTLMNTSPNTSLSEDVSLCQTLAKSLKGSTLHWYTQLPANSIDLFVTLKKKFSTQYSTSHPHHLTPTTLVNMQQGENEPLCSFMGPFSNISVKIHNLNPEVALHSMFMALKVDPFFDSLCRDPPTTMDELRMRATSYIQMEEMAKFRDNVRAR